MDYKYNGWDNTVYYPYRRIYFNKMTEKQDETCENCGYTHSKENYFISCKKFKPKTKSSLEEEDIDKLAGDDLI